MAILSVSHLGKSFGAERVFADVSFKIDEHDRIGLVGPNGAGKSTLLNILAGYEEADEGTRSLARTVRVGYLTQHVDFQPTNTLREEMLTVFEHLRAGNANWASWPSNWRPLGSINTCMSSFLTATPICSSNSSMVAATPTKTRWTRCSTASASLARSRQPR